MKTTQYSHIILDEEDIIDMYMTDPDRPAKPILAEKAIRMPPELELDPTITPTIRAYVDPMTTVEDFDLQCTSNWHMPDSYKTMDIVVWVLDQCKTDVELQRCGEELIMYAERDLLDMLRYLKYLVDHMRANNIVWGVGRGSSSASYVLYLIGVHKIDSIYYDLPITEFLK